MVKRCDWGESENPLYMDYHDKEWGVPVHDERFLFEMIILEGAQAGLSWSTIINKRANYKKAFDNFEFEKVAKYNEKKVEELMNNAGIVRNRRKITSAITNAQAFIKVREEFGSFDKYIWGFVDNTTIQNNFKKPSNWPAKTSLSEQISKDLLKRGFKFVGPTIVYAFMQAIGIVNDHLTYCFRYNELKSEK
ncbi:MAG TPA: DNA-3-methyladenine glycosylase I [Candidatus Glassbacteria bacterium]|nr:DNA-3-methyladenine glycosylase I [Candidatus Glassbacteria bacterium]